MTGNVAGDCDLTYAVVDKTKKKNRSIPPKIPLKLFGPDSAEYSVVDKTKIIRDTPEKTYGGNNDDSPKHEENVYFNAEMSETVADNSALHYDSSAPMSNVLDRSVAKARSPERSQQINSALCYKEREKNDLPKMKKCGILIALLLAIALFMAAGVALIVAFVQINQLRAEIALVQSTLLMETTMANTVNITSLAESVRAFEITIVELDNHLDNIHKSIQRSLINQINCLASIAGILVDILNETGYAFGSCADIRQFCPSFPSDNYHVRSYNGSAVRVYCDMTRSCGNITGGWMRVAELDMTDNTTQCPSSLDQTANPRRTCRTRTGNALCSSDMFTVSGVGYSKVCGRIRAYQVGTPDAFGNSNSAANSSRETSNPNIETYYVDGISLTHGSPRRHIWTFAAVSDEGEDNPKSKCPCINTVLSIPPSPSFVGEDYFCDTAVVNGVQSHKVYADDPLWDGAGCGPQNTCCSFNTPPWFYKQLPQPTTDDIEMRVCRDEGRWNEDIAIEVVEIYVQ